MRRLLTCALVVASAGVVLAACGDGPDAGADEPAATATVATPATAGDGFGPPPRLGDNIVAVTPEHGQRIPQAATRPIAADRPGGLCFDTVFDGLDESPLLWFRLAFDGREVTTEITWFPREGNTKALGCFMPEEGLPVGRHDAAVAVQNPGNPDEPTRQLVAWQFEVTE